MRLDVGNVLKRLGIEGKGRGEHLVALCPYHDEHNPSWRIRRRGEKAGLHWCQACQSGGDIIDLVKHVKSYGTREGAKAWLERAGEEVTEKDLEIDPVRMVYAPLARRGFRMPPGFEGAGDLEGWPTIAVDYAGSRGIGQEQVRRWGIGYALEGRLKGRIVIPIRNARGALVSYVGRTFVGAERRFLYPREEERAEMGVLFGEERWPGVETRVSTTVVVTEGAIKSLAVERATGLHHAAVGGSGLRLGHVAKLATFGTVVVLTDADDAGEALGASLEGSLARHVKVRRVRLPPGQDADTVSVEELRGALE